MSHDPVMQSFLISQHAAAMDLAANSDVLTLYALPEPVGPPSRYLARFRCISVLRAADGTIGPAESDFGVGIALRDEHLRFVDPLRVITWLGPADIVLPNIRPPHVCVGHVFPGVELVDLLYSVYEILCMLNYATDDALNEEAAMWARSNQHLLPVERRSLRRRKADGRSRHDAPLASEDFSGEDSTESGGTESGGNESGGDESGGKEGTCDAGDAA